MSRINHSILSDKDINSCFSGSQRPFQYAIQSDIIFDKEKIKDVAIVLTKHFIYGLNSKNSPNGKKKKNLKIFEIHIHNIDQIEKKPDKYIQIGNSSGSPSLIIYSLDKKATTLVQLLYRNIVLSYYDQNAVELNWDDNSKFPEIDIRYLSPSQVFQFNYFAYCTLHSKKYNHDFVRYFHNIIIEDSPIIDFSVLSPKYFRKRLNSLKCAKNLFRGICLRNYPYPEVIKNFAQLIADNPNIKIVSFSNSNCNKGLAELANVSEQARKKKKSFGVTYWDLSYNQFNNFSYFSTVIENSTEPIKYLNLNGCNISDEDSEILFSSLEKFEHVKKLKFLSISGASFNSSHSVNAFKRFLKVSRLSYLDIGGIPDVADLITAIEKQGGLKSLKTLILKNTLLETRSFDDLLSIIQYSENLVELDISGTGLRVDSISSIIEAINDNPNIKQFSLKLDSLELHGKSLKSVIKSFTDDDDETHSSTKSKKSTKSTKKSPLKKWKSLSFSSNELNYNDLAKLIDLFKKMPRLETVYLDDNFDRSMEGIGDLLCDLLQPNTTLTGISLSGSKKHKLGDELDVFLKEAAKTDNIEFINIENNGLDDESVQSIKNLLIKSKSLKTLKIDHNSFTSLSKIKSIVDAIDACQSLTTFGFPLFNSANICGNDENGKAEEKLNQLQSRANFIVSQHRREQKSQIVEKDDDAADESENNHLKCMVPFDVENEDVECLLASIVNKFPKVLPSKRRYHSFACELFGLPFPFQTNHQTSADCKLDVFRQEKSDNLTAYDKTEAIIEYIKEPQRQFSYPDKKTICYLPTYGPTIERILDDEYLKPPKSSLVTEDRSSKSTKKKKEAAVKFPTDLKAKGKSQRNVSEEKNAGSGKNKLKTIPVDSGKLDELVDTNLYDENELQMKGKSKQSAFSQKKKKRYDNEEYNKNQPLSKTLPNPTKKNAFDEESDDEASSERIPKKPVGKQKKRVDDERDSDDDNRRFKPLSNGRRIQDEDDESSENEDRQPIRNRNVRQLKQQQNSSSSSDDENEPFLRQRPTSKVIPVSSDSYMIRNRNDDDDDDNIPRNRSFASSSRLRKSSAAYDPSNSTDDSMRSSDDNDDVDVDDRRRNQYEGTDIFKVSPMPKPPHLKSPQSALAFAYDLMIADEQSGDESEDSDE